MRQGFYSRCCRGKAGNKGFFVVVVVFCFVGWGLWIFFFFLSFFFSLSLSLSVFFFFFYPFKKRISSNHRGIWSWEQPLLSREKAAPRRRAAPSVPPALCPSALCPCGAGLSSGSEGPGWGDKRARQAGKGRVWEGVEMLIPHLEFLSGKFSCLCVVSIYIML